MRPRAALWRWQARLEPRVSIVTLELRTQSTISAAEAEKAPDKQPHASALDSFIFSFRQAHGASHEAAIETSAVCFATSSAALVAFCATFFVIFIGSRR